jgi:hypothetical protein
MKIAPEPRPDPRVLRDFAASRRASAPKRKIEAGYARIKSAAMRKPISNPPKS